MGIPLKEIEERVYRTYKGGKLLSEFCGRSEEADGFQPEDWISSFVEAKNKTVIPGEGLTGVFVDGEIKNLRDAVSESDFGEGRTDAGVLVKLLDSAERLGIQVHPTKEYARKIFSSEYGKTECWHILKTRSIGGESPCVYIGFKEHVTKELWRELFMKQDVAGMLAAMHRLEVKCGDTVIVPGGTPHAIGAGCFMLEIQEPTDYTMRAEKITVGGEVLTPMQIHYGVGEENMLDCFEYIPLSDENVKERFLLKSKRDEIYDNVHHLVSYFDTPHFRLDKISGGVYRHLCDSFVTVIITEDGGTMSYSGGSVALSRSDKYFIPANTEITLESASALVCYPPKIEHLK